MKKISFLICKNEKSRYNKNGEKDVYRVQKTNG